jgi:hypothetical protein
MSKLRVNALVLSLRETDHQVAAIRLITFAVLLDVLTCVDWLNVDRLKCDNPGLSPCFRRTIP